MGRTVTLNFFGKQYDLKADDPSDDVEAVVRYVERVMEETEQRHSGLSPQKIMVLAALHMGRDYVRESEKNRKLIKALNQKSARLAHRIDSVLSEVEEQS